MNTVQAVIDTHIRRYKALLIDCRATLVRAYRLPYDASPIIDVTQGQIKILEIRIDTLRELALCLNEQHTHDTCSWLKPECIDR